MKLVEGLLCPLCKRRVPLVDAGVHITDRHPEEDKYGHDMTTWGDGAVLRSSREPRREREVHDPERIAGGIRGFRPWSQPSP